MLQLKNTTPFAADTAIFPNEQGVDSVYVIVKATFKIGTQWTLAEEQRGPTEKDIYWLEPDNSSIKFASDYHLGKLTSDVIIVGQAYASQGQSSDELDVNVSVGQVSKTIRVYGDRIWQQGRISAPKPFKTMPMIYEKAFGGKHVVDHKTQSACMRNPLGCGFAGNRSVREMEGVPLPNLEDPEQLIRKHTDQPQPACMAYTGASWQPRSNYVGTYDEKWKTQRAPYLPENFDKRFFSMAHDDLVYPGFIQGGEAVEITNMHPSGDLKFNLPRIKLVSKINISDRVESPEFQLETLVIEPDQLLLSMVWKAQLVCDKEVLKINDVGIYLSR